MEWNVIVSVKDGGYKTARQFLHEYGQIRSTDFYNVLIMSVESIDDFLEDMHALYDMKVPALKVISRLVPATRRFTYQTPEEFETKARDIVMQWLDDLAGRKFYVRMHRRGFKGKLSSQEEERFLDTFILAELEKRSQSAQIDFSDPDRVISVETLGPEAGLSLWTHDQIARYPFLRLD